MIINVYVCEDEPFIMRSLKLLIEQSHSNYRIIGEAYNGLEAYEEIKRLKPDVVFTDIRMPGMDGLALLSKLNEEHYEFTPVLISGYQDFEYAKTAIKLHVYDYILKPVSPESFEELLISIHARLESTIRTRQLSIINQMVTNISYKNGKVADFFKYAGYYYMFLCAGSYCTFTYPWITPSLEFWLKNDLEAVATQRLNDIDASIWVINGKHENEKIIVMGTNQTNHSEISEWMRHLHEQLNTSGFPLTSIYSFSGSKIEDIGPAIQTARIVLNKHIVFAQSSFLLLNTSITVENQDDHGKLLSADTEKLLVAYIQHKQLYALKRELKKLLEKCLLRTCRQISLEHLLKSICELFKKNIDFLSEKRAIEIDMEINELICNSISYKAIYEGMAFIMESLLASDYAKAKESDHEKLSGLIEHYIEENYSNTINLQSLSLIFGIVPSYLSKIFKSYKGKSPSDYIIELRVEKAKELLKSKPMIALKDIAVTVGFNDQFYFSKVFKTITAQSPSEFRKNTTSI
ncbi:response regulator transcription factor [Cohnella silvisoli]|uniref:Response regulator n=1 Tax=Cohnella silvisoli TaxID=2873699 RepID=A0ABV1KTI3_9BACL|nr:response regulator [Cohnella silvisoli]MCD9021455.1 response regulator [Cohnella silvisoli]